MHKPLFYSLLAILFCACLATNQIEKQAKLFREYRTYESLAKVVELLPADADTNLVRKLLGDPINFGFDYRYLIDSLGPNGCSIGAVFHIGEAGIIDQKWIDEICE